MTKTALRALLVSALSAAALLTVASPALAETPAPLGAPAATECLPGEEFQYGFGCVAVQLPDETQGRETDPVTVSADPCFRQDAECYGVSKSKPVDRVTVTPHRRPTVQQRHWSAPRPRLVIRKAVIVRNAQCASCTAGKAVSQPLPDWVVLDKLTELDKMLARVQWARAH